LTITSLLQPNTAKYTACPPHPYPTSRSQAGSLDFHPWEAVRGIPTTAPHHNPSASGHHVGSLDFHPA